MIFVVYLNQVGDWSDVAQYKMPHSVSRAFTIYDAMTHVTYLFPMH